jgi:DNA repair exonuclease SbcCD ATPase subunit
MIKELVAENEKFKEGTLLKFQEGEIRELQVENDTINEKWAHQSEVFQGIIEDLEEQNQDLQEENKKYKNAYKEYRDATETSISMIKEAVGCDGGWDDCCKQVMELKEKKLKLSYYSEFVSVSESYGCYCDWVKEYHPDKLKEAGVWVEDEE